MTSRKERQKNEQILKSPKEHAGLVFQWVTEEFNTVIDDPHLDPIDRIHQLFSIVHHLEADQQKLTHYNIYKDIEERLENLIRYMYDCLDSYLESLIETKTKIQ